MMVSYGLAAWPFVAAKYGLHQRWRAFTALIGVAALLAAVLSFASAARAATIAGPGDARSGSLILKTEGEGYTDAERLGVDVDVTVSGPTLRARVTQVFRNTTNDWVEATYVYPLPDDAAIDTLKMVIGDRVVVGDIKERQQARAIYEAAKQNGQKAALTEQERPNIFTNAVANIGPGETVLVQIEYQEPVHQSGDQFSLRIPMVVGPRYNPAPVAQTVDLRTGDNGWGTAANDPVTDRNRISPPVLDPRDHAPVNPTTISIRLQAGFPIGEVKSHFHNVKIDSPGTSTRVITLADGAVPADRDFELTWTAAAGKAPSVGLFREQVAGRDYLLAYVTPPAVSDAEQKPLPREVIFVIDNSGSMGGTSIAQAKAGLLYALGLFRIPQGKAIFPRPPRPCPWRAASPRGRAPSSSPRHAMPDQDPNLAPRLGADYEPTVRCPRSRDRRSDPVRPRHLHPRQGHARPDAAPTRLRGDHRERPRGQAVALG